MQPIQWIHCIYSLRWIHTIPWWIMQSIAKDNGTVFGEGDNVQMRDVHLKAFKTIFYAAHVDLHCLSSFNSVHFISVFFLKLQFFVFISLCNLDDSLHKENLVYKNQKCITNSFHACALVIASQATHIHARTPF